MMDKQGWARLAERVRRLYLPPSGLPVFCTSCEVDATTGLCNGCLRSLSEIMGWADLDEEGKHLVWARIQTRLFALRDAESAARRAGPNKRRVPPASLLSEPEALPGPEAPSLAEPSADEPGEPAASVEALAAQGAEPDAAPDEVPDATVNEAADPGADAAAADAVPASEAAMDEAAVPAEPALETPVEAVAAPVEAPPALETVGTRADAPHADAAKPGEAEIRLQPLI